MSTIKFSLILTLLSTLALQAAQLHVLPWDEAIAKRELSIGTGEKEGKSEPVLNMHHLQRSSPIKVSTKAENLQLIVNDRTDEEGKPLTLALKIPKAVTRPLLLILPDKKSPAGLKTIIIDDSIANFKWGTTRFINVTGEVLVFRYDKKNKLIPSGWDPVDVAPGGATRNMAVLFYLRKDLKRPPLYSSIWKHRDDLRQLVFIVPSKDTSRSIVDFKFLSESKAVEEALKKPAAANNAP